LAQDVLYQAFASAQATSVQVVINRLLYLVSTLLCTRVYVLAL